VEKIVARLTAAIVCPRSRFERSRWRGGLESKWLAKHFALFLRTLYRQDWVVYAQPPFGGPQHVLHYLARYTHRVAISNHRLLSVSASEVCFRWKDYAHHSKQRTMTLASDEFLRRFVQHVLPRGTTLPTDIGRRTIGISGDFLGGNDVSLSAISGSACRARH